MGHVGDGNFHIDFVLDPDDEAELAATGVNERLIARALAIGGTCTGEHGEGVSVMRAIKQVLDPANLMNPGKIVDPEGAG